MRGKGITTRLLFPVLRITPAYAGKRCRCGKRGLARPDHPRVCGEKGMLRLKHSHKLGSPPRMRGKASPQKASEPVTRITPAYAGKSYVFGPSPARSWDHPRVCGEKGCSHPSGTSPMGSPPRMRGKGYVKHTLVFCTGITPAYAGKSFCPQRLIFRPTDHPRVCGEKQPCVAALV